MSVSLTGPPAEVRPSHLDLPLVRARAGRVLRSLGHARSELSVALVDDAEIAELNARYRDKKRSTDVLSFSLLEGEHSNFRGGLLGDVVISIETAARQARARHRSVNEEVARLLIHGVLHLLGHDHEKPIETQRMRAEERRLWATVRMPGARPR